MQVPSVAVLLIAAVFGVQTSVAVSQGAVSAPAPGSNAPPVTASTITIPAGTAIPLTLVSSIKSKSSKAGDTVRAIVAFPVTSGTQMAIPAGTYAEGVLSAVTARAPHTNLPAVQIRFTRLLFANGYSVQIDADNTQAELALPATGSEPAQATASETSQEGTVASTPARGSFGLLAQQQEPPTLPRVGPSPAVIGGAVGGGFAALMVSMFVWAHHRAVNTDYVLYDAGWPHLRQAGIEFFWSPHRTGRIGVFGEGVAP